MMSSTCVMVLLLFVSKSLLNWFIFSMRRRHARCALVTGSSDMCSSDLVFTNQGPKRPALKALIGEYAPSHALFIDDLPQHHESASQAVPLTIDRQSVVEGKRV